MAAPTPEWTCRNGHTGARGCLSLPRAPPSGTFRPLRLLLEPSILFATRLTTVNCRPYHDAGTACAAVQHLPELRTLSLQRLPLSDAAAALAPLGRCRQLRRLHLTLHDAPAAALPGLCTLTQLTAIRLWRGLSGPGLEAEERVREGWVRVTPAAILGLQVRALHPHIPEKRQQLTRSSSSASGNPIPVCFLSLQRSPGMARAARPGCPQAAIDNPARKQACLQLQLAIATTADKHVQIFQHC